MLVLKFDRLFHFCYFFCNTLTLGFDLKLLIIEANEIPPKLFRHYSKIRPKSFINNLLKQTNLIETIANDVEYDFLYPSQTWASFNTGLPYREHKIHWYNDPKNFEDFYWHYWAQKRKKTMIVSTLHSSPLETYINQGNYCLAIPDCFAPTSTAYPKKFQPFQSFNLAVVEDSRRQTQVKKLILGTATNWLANPSFGNWGLSSRSCLSIGKSLLGGLLHNKERLRTAQFPLIGEIFLKGLIRKKPSLAVLFTNHVAANMHRYWYALFPDDFCERLYPKDWVKKYQNEILFAMDELDKYLKVIGKIAKKNGYTMLVTTSMGQGANLRLSQDDVNKFSSDYRLEDPLKFFNLIFGKDSTATFESAMVPQYTFRLKSNNECLIKKLIFEKYFSEKNQNGMEGKCDINGNKITFTIHMVPEKDKAIRIRNSIYSFKDFGFVKFTVDDHHSGKHHPLGSILVANDPKQAFRPLLGRQINYLEFAPKIKNMCA